MAFAQWYAARRDAKALKEVGLAHWTEIHCFYANMGGIVLRIDYDRINNLKTGRQDGEQFIIQNADYIKSLIQRCPGVFPVEDLLTERDIADKSKADGFVKAVACIQATWLVAQCIGRAAQRLPITTLELSTMAYTLYALVNYLLWWNKPLDVATATIYDITDRVKNGEYNRVYRYSGSSLLGGSTTEKHARIPNDCNNGFNVRYAQYPMIICCVVFGGIHCIAWNFSFPTHVEQAFWRSACLVSALVLPPIALTMTVFDFVRHVHEYPSGYPNISASMRQRASRITDWRDHRYVTTLVSLMVFILLTCYCLARIYLIVEVFISLRSLPTGCYQTVDWSKFIPHIT
jgi:hypothetical protein